MKKGKIILGAAAFVLTAGTLLAMKARSKYLQVKLNGHYLQFKFNGHFQVLGTVSGVCTVTTCSTMNGLPPNEHPPICRTFFNGFLQVNTVNREYFHAKRIDGNCTTPTVHWTHHV